MIRLYLDAGLTVNGLTLSFDDTRITDADGNGTASAYQWQTARHQHG